MPPPNVETMTCLIVPGGARRRLILLAAMAGAVGAGACVGPESSNSQGSTPPVEESLDGFLHLGALYAEAESLHAARNLGAASRRYRRLLEADPAPELREADLDLAVRLAPLLWTHPDEPFGLEDVVAILHPDEPVIAYHLFWDDDIDFPDDNEPADHELVWVSYDPETLKPTELATYFHGEIVRRAMQSNGLAGTNSSPGSVLLRLPVFVEWGKHGSLPDGPLGSRADWPPELQANWRRLHHEGTRRAGHPLASGWPVSFAGDFEAYQQTSGPLDPVPLLLADRAALRTRWANAVLDQRFLTYNFSPKPAWP